MLEDSVVLVASTNPKKKNVIGTGFVIHENRCNTYIVTCAHVIDDLGGKEEEDNIRVNNYPVKIEALGNIQGFDLAVLKSEILLRKSTLRLKGRSCKTGKAFKTTGFYLYGEEKKYSQETIEGTLASEKLAIHPTSQLGMERAAVWELEVRDGDCLRKGYSGSPIVDPTTGYVMAVATNMEKDGKVGRAISIEALEKIWLEIPPTLKAELIVYQSGTTPSKPASDYLVGILVDVSHSMKTSIQNRDDRVQSRIEGFRESLHQVVDKAKSNQQENSEVKLFALGFGFGNPLSWLRGDFKERVRDLLRLPQSEPTTTISQLVDDWERYEENIEEMVKSMGGDTPMRQALEEAEIRLTAEINKNYYKENPILFILSDGLPTDDPEGEIPRLIKRVKDKGIIIVSCYITDQNLTKSKCLYGKPEENWDDAATFMFHCASVPRKKTSPLYSYLRERNWEIQDNGRLFAQVNETEFLEEFLEVIVSPLMQEDESSSG